MELIVCHDKNTNPTERHKDDIADGIGACEATNTRQDRRHYLLWAELFTTHQQQNNKTSP